MVRWKIRAEHCGGVVDGERPRGEDWKEPGMQEMRAKEGDDQEARSETLQAVLPRRCPRHRIQEILMRWDIDAI